jgi:hypothetical protein
MLARFSRLHHGFDLLEGNVHDQDRPLSTKLEMLDACKRPFIQALPLDPIPLGEDFVKIACIN